MNKVLTWILVNGASILGSIQAVLKCVKEILTAIINLLSLLMPVSTAQAIVIKVRGVVEAIDAFIEKYKAVLIPKV